MSRLRDADPRARLAALLDPGTLCEIPTGQASPWLPAQGRAAPPEDGVVLALGTLGGRRVLCAAQDGRFMGGTLGEIHTSLLVGLVQAAVRCRPDAVLFLLDSGGVRLHEANSAELGAAVLARAVLEARAAGIPCLACVAGTVGCFGGACILAAACDAVVAEGHALLGVSGPKVIALAAGAAEVDAEDPAAVRRLMGAEARLATGELWRVVPDGPAAMGSALLEALGQAEPLDLYTLVRRRAELRARHPGVAGAPVPPEVPPDAGLLADLRAVFPDGLDVRVRGGLVSGEGVLAGGRVAVAGCVDSSPVGVAEAQRLTGQLLGIMEAAAERPVLLLCDAAQAFSWRNEALGFSAWLGLLAGAVTVARLRGHRVVGLLRRRTSGATGIVLGMLADELHALEGAELHALPPVVMERFAPRGADAPLLRAPDVAAAYGLGTVRGIGSSGIAEAFLRREREDRRRSLGAERSGHSAPGVAQHAASAAVLSAAARAWA